jgi:AcrR family transcriptional regulator
MEDVAGAEQSGAKETGVQDSGAESPEWRESLRERKKRLTRALISDTATEMFLERGFDDVTVAEVAEACGVSEKTVFNYFPTKEALLFDREPETAAELWRALGPGSTQRSPVEGVVGLLAAERQEMLVAWDAERKAVLRRFSELIDASPSLQAARRDMADRLERTAAEALAARAGVRSEEPEPRLAAAALMALIGIHEDALSRCAVEGKDATETAEVVAAEVARAARVAESGLWWFGALTEGRPNRQQLDAAADAARQAGRQVVTAVRQAKVAWEELQRQGPPGRTGEPPVPGWASLFEGKAKWKRDMLEHKDEWKRAYREEQLRLRRDQRELAHQIREGARGRRRGGPGPGSRRARPNP